MWSRFLVKIPGQGGDSLGSYPVRVQSRGGVVLLSVIGGVVAQCSMFNVQEIRHRERFWFCCHESPRCDNHPACRSSRHLASNFRGSISGI